MDPNSPPAFASLPARQSARIIEGGRLAYYRAAASADYWDRHWKTMLVRETYRSAECGSLGYFEDVFRRWLPAQGKILEAGCGLGTFIVALRRLGYDCEGVEWGAETVRGVRSLYPDLPIRIGDAMHLEVPDGHYRAYISLGVVEHRREGPQPFLREARRVLADDGVALISVPHLNLPRLQKAAKGLFADNPAGLEFYQYAFHPNDFTGILAECGLRVVEQLGYDPWKGIKDEWRWIAPFSRVPWFGPRLRSRWQRWEWARQRFGHMMLFVCCRAETQNGR